MDTSDGSVVNVWFGQNTYFDQWSVAGVYMVDAPASATDVRGFYFDCRCGSNNTTTGRNIIVEKQSAVPVWTSIRLSGFLVSESSNENVLITGANFLNCRIDNARISSFQPKNSAIVIASDGWSICNNSIGRNTGAPSGYTNGITVTNADITTIDIFGNTFDKDIPNPIVVPTWSVANPTPLRRYIELPGERRAAVLSLYDAAFVSALSGVTLPQTNTTDVRLSIISGGSTISTLPNEKYGNIKVITNYSATPVTITYGVASIRTINATNITLRQYESATFMSVNNALSVWQQIAGRPGSSAAIADDASGAANQAKLNEVIAALRSAGIILP